MKTNTFIIFKTAFGIPFTLGLAILMVSPAAAQETVEKTLTIKAKPRQILEAIVRHRRSEPDKRKVVSTKNNGAVVIQERLDSPLSIARDTISYEELIHDNRVTYHLLNAEKLSKFEGSWTLTETKPGYTTVKLSSTVDSTLSVPFKGKILRHEATKGIDERMSFVKHESERLLVSER